MGAKHVMLKGLPAAPGIAIGPAYLVGDLPHVDQSRLPEGADVEAEVARLRDAIREASDELSAAEAHVAELLGPDVADIFQTHRAMLEDQVFIDKMERLVRRDRFTAEAAAAQVVSEAAAVLDAVDDRLLRDRAEDIRDIGQRLLTRLAQGAQDLMIQGEEGVVLAADTIRPSHTVRLDPAAAAAFVSEHGGTTSHASILARSLGVPAVVGVRGLFRCLSPGVTLAVNGFNGTVHVNPTPEIIAEYRRLRDLLIRSRQEELAALIDQPAVTKDGAELLLQANLAKSVDVEAARHYGADGVGLFRTEFHFGVRQSEPSEEEQFEAYRMVVERAPDPPPTIRTLDVGGDKPLPWLRRRHETNPYLGLRGIRFCFEYEDIFRRQLRALLRLRTVGPIRIMLPMVSALDEIDRARALIDEVETQLRAEGLDLSHPMDLGVMIEVPSLALVADQVLAEVDFGSVGSNDLLQYIVAADRNADEVEEYNDPCHPGFLRLLARIADAARATDTPLSICGELAGDPLFTRLLIGLGYRTLSMAALRIPDVKKVVLDSSLEACRELAGQVLACRRRADVRRLLHRHAPASEFLPAKACTESS